MLEHITFEEYTSMDKNIEALTKVKAHCLFLSETRSCGVLCDKCPVHARFMACYNALALCDQLRLDYEAERRYMTKRILYRRYRLYILQRRIVKGIAIAALGFLLMLAAHKAHGIPYELSDRYIRNVLRATHSQVYDLNADGEVNCIDYAVTFKSLWDKCYPPSHCEIVRNYNRQTGWHHLFVAVYVGKWLTVEPQGYVSLYRMTDFWGPAYDPDYNKFGETTLWLSEAVREEDK